MNKAYKFILIIPLLLNLFYVAPSYAANTPTEYTLLAPLPLNGVDTTKTTAKPYIEGLFKLSIALAGVLAVIMLIFAGIEYMSTDAFTGKSDAKRRIENAFWGLGLVIGAWLILYTINPKLVEINLTIPVQEIPQNASTTGGIVQGPSYGKSWEADDNLRNQLINYPNTDININFRNCLSIGETSCTSVTGLSSSVINGVESLAKNCRCYVTISGGTEYWLHGNKSTEIDQNPTAHKPGGNVVDLSFATNFTTYIRKNGTKTTTTACSNLGTEKYTYNGATYVLENNPTHWHVCF